MARRLEADGLNGRLLLIDGHPRLLQQMAVAAFEGRPITYETTLDVSMENYLSLILPGAEPTAIAAALGQQTTLDAKIAVFENFPKIKMYKANWLRDFITGLTNRLSITLNVDDFHIRIQSPITLVRPKEYSAQLAHDQAELNKYTTGTVYVAHVDGTHITMLENGNLLAFINENYLVHDT